MLRYMVIAAPRSGTAWCANWFSTAGAICLHDPLYDYHFEDLNGLNIAGVACTGLGYFHEWVNAQHCPILVLHRPPHEICASLKAIGLEAPPEELYEGLRKITGWHLPWDSLFGWQAADICAFLGIGFDERRWKLLRGLRVTSRIEARQQNPSVLARLAAHLKGG